GPAATAATEAPGQADRGRDIRLADAGLAVDAEADGHAALGNGEQRFLGPGQGAPGEGDAERARAFVRESRDAHHGLEVVALGARGARGLEDREVAGDAAALVLLDDGRARDVVGHRDGLAGDARRAELLLRGVEVEHVARVVTVGEEAAATLLTRRR